ncbi:MAG: hypothetical protein H6551_09800 [Chitinophagales bacterium]|nr:hypothetical protein [Chitinophagaceae bacterium]MCB9065418.1 hypothetical protein [Chitinophagales bacterium]
MTSPSQGHSKPDTKNTANRSAKEWFSVLVTVLLLWTGLYIYAHTDGGVLGFEQTSFTASELRQINNILSENTVTYEEQANNTDAYNDGFLDEYSEDYEEHKQQSTQKKQKTAKAEYELRVSKVMVFINSQYGNDIDPAQLVNIERYLKTFSRSQINEYLSGTKLWVRSYFWLAGPMVYAEVVFWVIFGVLCGMLFMLGKCIRKQNDLCTRDMLYQLAKLFYAPFFAVLVVIAYSYFKDRSTLNIDGSEGLIIIAFVIGFYSGTVMEILDRVKYILFNGGTANGNTMQQQTYAQPAAPQPQAYTPPPTAPTPPPAKATQEAPKTEPQEAPEPEAEEQAVEELEAEHIETDEEDDYFDNIGNTPPQTVVKGDKEERKGDSNEIEEVAIDLKLDFSALFDEEKEELQKLGFSKAIVTLHNVNGRDIIPTQKLNEDMTTFIAHNVKPGIYIARATLSQRMRDNQIINLFGEKTAYITEDKPGMELYVKKYEALS